MQQNAHLLNICYVSSEMIQKFLSLFVDLESKAQKYEINGQVTPIASHPNTLTQWSQSLASSENADS